MKKTILATSISLALMAAASQAWSDARTLKFHSGLAESRPEAASLERFSELVDEYSDGQLQVDVYHAGSLGLKEADMLRIMQRGMVDMALMYGEYYNRDAPEMASIYAQGAITESEQHLDILPTLRELYREGYADWGVHTIGGVVAPVFDVGLHCKEPVNTLEGLRDKKVRVWSGHLVETFDRLGISAQVIPQNDMYLALQTGVVDCAYYLSTVAQTVSLQEVTDYEAYLHPWAASPWMFGVSDRTWNSLDEQQQEVLTRAGEEIWQETRDQAVDPEREAEARKEREAMGITMLPAFSDEDVQTFVDAAWEAWHEMASKAGDEGIRYYDTVTGELQSDSQ